jgi:arylformamidase
MQLIDLSQPMYDGCPNCPVHPPVSAKAVATHTEDSLGSWHMEHVSTASHTGSHLDAPLHKIRGGKAIDDFPLDAFMGPAHIVDLRGIAPRTPITAAMLAGKLSGDLAGSIVLLATGWGDKRAVTNEWHFDAPFLSEEGARWLVERGIKMVGIDHYSIGGSAEPGNAATHTVLLSALVLIVEDLHFPAIAFTVSQPVQFMALPVNFRGFSGSFCRPVLMLL